jgi:glutamyl-tRNA reductase
MIIFYRLFVWMLCCILEGVEGLYTAIGLSHQAAPCDIRESVTPKNESVQALLLAISRDCELQDVVILSTCSRFEVYATLTEDEISRVKAWLNQRAGRNIEDYLYVHRGRAAMTHILRVAAGLDSWIVGETEVLGQVKSAYKAACTAGTASRNSHLAFQRSLNAGKRIRSETAIVGGIRSIGGAAAIMARRIFSDIADKNILIFGAGAMAESTAKHLCAKGVKRVSIANRSPEKAAKLAKELGGEPLTLDEGMSRLEDADIAVFSTSVSDYLLTHDQAKELSQKRKGRTIFLIDLGLPRNVDPKISDLAQVYNYDMDDLKRIVRESMDRRKADTLSAEEIVEEETQDLWGRIIAPPKPRPHVERPKPSHRLKFANSY